MEDDDIVMESTTDSADQIAEGLGVELAPDTSLETADTATGDEAVQGDAPEQVAAGDDAQGDEPQADAAPGEVTPEPSRVAAPKRAARPQRKTADAAAAAARRASEADRRVLEEENAALRRRLSALNGGDVAVPAAAAAVPAQIAPVVLAPEDIPDTHPELAAMQSRIAALGARPAQADYEDFDQFEAARDQWIEDRATLRARMDTVREDVARRESLALDAANRAAADTAAAFAQTVAAARTRHADYDDAMAVAREQDLRVPRELGQALMESPVGADVLYHLVKNPAEVDRITALSPTRALTELGIIEGRIAARLAGRPGAPAPQSVARPGARVTRAPEPQRTVLGEMPSLSKPANINDPNLSQAEYNRLRDQMDRDSGRRTH